MQFDNSATAELPKLNLPQELLTEVNRGGPKAKTHYGIEGLGKPSLLHRIVEKVFGK